MRVAAVCSLTHDSMMVQQYQQKDRHQLSKADIAVSYSTCATEARTAWQHLSGGTAGLCILVRTTHSSRHAAHTPAPPCCSRPTCADLHECGHMVHIPG
jgi:non-ribosomal peptide synthetase component E (peptide arylation enzyme)